MLIVYLFGRLKFGTTLRQFYSFVPVDNEAAIPVLVDQVREYLTINTNVEAQLILDLENNLPRPVVLKHSPPDATFCHDSAHNVAPLSRTGRSTASDRSSDARQELASTTVQVLELCRQ